MITKKEISTLEDIKSMVDAFYEKVRQDGLLRDIFNEKIEERWPDHLEKMYRFWQTVLLEEHTYFGSPFVPHARLAVGKEHFDRWVQLFFETIDERFFGEKAEKAKWQGNRMAEIFHTKIQYHQNSSVSSIP
ncbi:MAG TPA: group III truncated hemoglobin [Lunatimonas sp.]|nr:group III truncated hemoglobin [Lunatimonas sp.]